MTRRRAWLSALLALHAGAGLASLAGGCRDFGDVVTDPPLNSGTIVFETDVLPIFQNRCGGGNCHRAPPFAAGLDLTDANAFASLVGVSSTQDGRFLRVKPADADSSLLLLKLLPGPPVGARMPLTGGPLSSADIATIRTWIDSLPAEHHAGSHDTHAPR
jgi:hypothetical protein